MSQEGIGDVLLAEGNLDNALKSYRVALAIRERLTAADPGNTQWQRDLSISYNKVADVLTTQGRLDDALKAYQSALAIRVRLVAADRSNTQWQRDFLTSVGRINNIAYRFLLARNFEMALASADQAVSLLPGVISLHANRAHALMFLGRIEEARALYLRYRSQKGGQGEKSWQAIVLEGFAGLHQAVLTDPLMDEIEKRLASPD